MNIERDGDRIAAFTTTPTDAEILAWLDSDTKDRADAKVREALKLLRPAAIQYTLAGEENLAQGIRLSIGNLEDTLEGTV